MINFNIVQVVGEAFKAHQIIARRNERMADTVARALQISENDANRRVGILSHKDNEPVLNTLARLIGILRPADSSIRRMADACRQRQGYPRPQHAAQGAVVFVPQSVSFEP